MTSFRSCQQLWFESSPEEPLDEIAEIKSSHQLPLKSINDDREKKSFIYYKKTKYTLTTQPEAGEAVWAWCCQSGYAREDSESSMRWLAVWRQGAWHRTGRVWRRLQYGDLRSCQVCCHPGLIGKCCNTFWWMSNHFSTYRSRFFFMQDQLTFSGWWYCRVGDMGGAKGLLLFIYLNKFVIFENVF